MSLELVDPSADVDALVALVDDPIRGSAAEAELWRRLSAKKGTAFLCADMLIRDSKQSRDKLIRICLARARYLFGENSKDDGASFINHQVGCELAGFAGCSKGEIFKEALTGKSMAYLPNRIYSRAVSEFRKEKLYRNHHIFAPPNLPTIPEEGDQQITPEEWVEWTEADPRKRSVFPCVGAKRFGFDEVSRDLDALLVSNGLEITAKCGEYGVELLQWLKAELSNCEGQSPRLLQARLTKHISGLSGVQPRQARTIKAQFLAGLRALPFAEALARAFNPYGLPEPSHPAHTIQWWQMEAIADGDVYQAERARILNNLTELTRAELGAHLRAREPGVTFQDATVAPVSGAQMIKQDPDKALGSIFPPGEPGRPKEWQRWLEALKRPKQNCREPIRDADISVKKKLWQRWRDAIRRPR
jgi:hypothetical protein